MPKQVIYSKEPTTTPCLRYGLFWPYFSLISPAKYWSNEETTFFSLQSHSFVWGASQTACRNRIMWLPSWRHLVEVQQLGNNNQYHKHWRTKPNPGDCRPQGTVCSVAATYYMHGVQDFSLKAPTHPLQPNASSADTTWSGSGAESLVTDKKMWVCVYNQQCGSTHRLLSVSAFSMAGPLTDCYLCLDSAWQIHSQTAICVCIQHGGSTHRLLSVSAFSMADPPTGCHLVVVFQEAISPEWW